MQALTLICRLKLRSFESSRQGTPSSPAAPFLSRHALAAPFAASFVGTRHPLRRAGLRVFPLSLSLAPSPNSFPPCRSTCFFSFSPYRSVSCSLRYERTPSRSLPLALFHFLRRSLERLFPFSPNIPANRSSLRLMFELSLSLVRVLSFPSFSFSVSRSLARRTLILSRSPHICLSSSICIHSICKYLFLFLSYGNSLARFSLLPHPNAWPKRKSVSLFSFLRTLTPVSPQRTNPTTFVEAVRDSQPNLRRRTLLAPTKPPPPSVPFPTNVLVVLFLWLHSIPLSLSHSLSLTFTPRRERGRILQDAMCLLSLRKFLFFGLDALSFNSDTHPHHPRSPHRPSRPSRSYVWDVVYVVLVTLLRCIRANRTARCAHGTGILAPLRARVSSTLSLITKLYIARFFANPFSKSST